MIYFLIGATLTVFVRDSWPLYSFCIAILLVLAVIACKRQLDRISLLPLLIPAFGLLQLVLSTTVYAPSTRTAALKWFALAGVLLIAQARLADGQRRERFLDQFVLFASLTAVLCLLQLHTSQGKVLWYLDSGYSDIVFGFFPSRNNFGQFVELALAVALWRAMSDRKRGLMFGIAAALLYASAIASTSRAAAVLTMLELLTVPAVVLWKARRKDLRNTGFLYAGVLGMALLWTSLSGWTETTKRFSEPGAYLGRREFAQSALQMAAAHPIVGNGLGTFSLVYPKYARIDMPDIVNFAHNDWAEFAADGGFVFAALILLLFAAAIPAMLRNPWSLGLGFVLIHAAFDYPFPRVAVAGWMFALLGAVKAAEPKKVREPDSGDPRGWIVPLALAGCCAFGIYWSARMGLGDWYFERSTEASVHRAIALVPDDARYYLRLAELRYSDSDAEPLLERSFQLNPYDAETLIGLGLAAEMRGEFPKAERILLEASQLDSTWLPRWTLANYYFRRGDSKGFWTWAAKAASNSSERRDFVPLFRLAAHLGLDQAATAAKILEILPDRPAPLRQLVGYLVEARQMQGLEPAADRLLAWGTEGNDRGFIFWAIEGFISNHQPDGAVRLWTKLRDRRWIRQDAGTGFTDPPLESSLDWRYQNVDGITRSLGLDGWLRLDFSGLQPEETGLVERFAPVQPGVKQRVEWRYKIDSAEDDDSGVAWEIESLNGGVLASSNLKSTITDVEGAVEFTPTESIVRVRLLYHRAPGTARITGAVELMPARVVERRESALLLLDHRQ